MKLVDHHVATEGIGQYLSECNHLYEYIFAKNGTFIHARNEVMEVLAPLVMIREQSRQIRGLIELTPFLKLPSKVSAGILDLMINLSRERLPDEVLFHINHSHYVNPGGWNVNYWKLMIPPRMPAAYSANQKITPDTFLSKFIRITRWALSFHPRTTRMKRGCASTACSATWTVRLWTSE